MKNSNISSDFSSDVCEHWLWNTLFIKPVTKISLKSSEGNYSLPAHHVGSNTNTQKESSGGQFWRPPPVQLPGFISLLCATTGQSFSSVPQIISHFRLDWNPRIYTFKFKGKMRGLDIVKESRCNSSNMVSS